MDGETFTATVTIASGKVASDLTNFVVLINLHDMPAGFWSAVKSDGGDIRAYDNTDTLIPHVVYNFATGTTSGILMVKRSVATASSTVIKVRCGNASLSALAVGNANGRNAVWSDYDIVVGFDGTNTDQTGTTRTVTGTSTTATVNTGFLKFADTDSGKKWVTLADRTVYTFGASYYLTSAISHNNGLVEYSNGNGDRQNLAARNVGPPAAIGLWNNDDLWLQPTSTGATASTLYRATGVLNNTTNRKLYLNGALLGTDTGATAHPINGPNFILGASTGAGEAANAEIGYAYLRNGNLTADWLAGEYANWHSPSTFYSVA